MNTNSKLLHTQSQLDATASYLGSVLLLLNAACTIA